MSKWWKFDWQHVALCIVFGAGLASRIVPLLLGHPPSVAVDVPIGVLAITAAVGFWKNPPRSLREALAQGEGDAVQAEAAKLGERGFVSLHALRALVVGGCLFIAPAGGAVLGSAAIQACTPAQVVTEAPAVATTGACIVTTVAADDAAGMQPLAVVDDVIAKCGTDALTVATLLDAETKAAVVESGGDAGALSMVFARRAAVATAAHAKASAIDAGGH